MLTVPCPTGVEFAALLDKPGSLESGAGAGLRFDGQNRPVVRLHIEKNIISHDNRADPILQIEAQDPNAILLRQHDRQIK